MLDDGFIHTKRQRGIGTRAGQIQIHPALLFKGVELLFNYLDWSETERKLR
jgi:hypothetical protein